MNMCKKDLPLEELIPIYYSNKSELDSYKKICDEQNAEIKVKMGDDNEFTVGNYKAKIIISNRESTNEDKLIEVMMKHGIDSVIKTKQYIDMDALEDYLYNNPASPELAKDIDNCIERKQVKSLKVTYKREK